MLDLISDGRVEFGIGEGATRLELRGDGIPARDKQAPSLEAAGQTRRCGWRAPGFSSAPS